MGHEDTWGDKECGAVATGRRAVPARGGVGVRPLVVAGKELKTYLLDVQALFFSLALPLLLVGLMVAAFGGQDEFHATAYVVNLDRGEVGADLVARLDAAPGIDVKLLDEGTAARRLDRSQILCAIVIPPGFSDDVKAGRPPELIIRRRGTGGREGQIVTSYALGLTREVAGEHLVAGRVIEVLAGMGRPAARETVDARVAALFAEARAEPPVEVVEEAVGARAEPVAIYLPGLVSMFALFSLTLVSVGIVEERKKGTLERLMTTRLTRGELLTGMWLGSIGRGLLQILFLLGVAWPIFRIFTPASFARVVAFSALVVVSAAGIGLVIAALARTAEQANWIAVFFTMVMTTLGGSFFDVSGARGVLGVASRLTYNFWANDGLRRLIARGETLASPAVLTDMAVLAGIAVVSWAVAAAFFRVRADER